MERASIEILYRAIEKLLSGFDGLPAFDQKIDHKKTEQVLLTVAEKMQENYPYQHPLYAGQMLKPPHPVAILSYTLAMLINPNNHAIDAGIASSRMEKEAILSLSNMMGWETCLGHLTGGGTLANLEALWISEKIHPGKLIIASQQAHYTHNRICDVLKIPFKSIAADNNGTMDVDDLKKNLASGKIGTVVVTMGTTGCGKVDPLSDILKLQAEYKFRIHVDAAYGGYFRLASNLPEKVMASFENISRADSIVIDPHKHGLQPYGCGCVLFKDPNAGKYYKHDSPYTYFTSDELHLGEISLECSRAGASSVALWATHKYYPLVKNGELAQNLEKSRSAAINLFKKINKAEQFITFFEPDLDIVVWSLKGRSSTQISSTNKLLFEKCADLDLHFALLTLPRSIAEFYCDIEWESDNLTCLRSCLMKPEHHEWTDNIFEILNKAATGI